MRTLIAASLVALALIGCRNDYQVQEKAIQAEAIVTFEVTSPAYGAFVGDGDAEVRGTVSPPGETVMVDGVPVESDPDSGAFAIDLPVDGAYLMIDIEGSDQVERIPVFSGQDPEDTWPGGVSARVLPAGLDRIGEEMGAVIDALDWAQTITDLLPSFTTDGFGIEAVGLLHEPTVVQLVGVPDAIDARVSLRDVGLEYSMWVDVLGNRIEAPISLFFGEIAIDALVVPSLTPEKTLSLELTEPEVIMDDPDITILVLEGPLLEWVLENIATWIIEPLGEVLLDLVLAEYGVIELPEPLSFETELLGMPLSIELSEIGGDVEGVRAGLGVGIDEPVSSVFTVPVPHDETTGTQVAMGVHEGLLDTMLNEDLLSQLDSFLAEEPAIGALLGGGITQLPGGDDAPEGAAWCVSMNPGTATVVRMQASIDPLAVLYAPDFVFTFGTLNNGVCEDWLVASLATEVGVGLDGTELTIDIQAPEGVILYYGADDYDEQEVVVALGDYVSNLVNLAGSFIDLDLGSLLGDLTLIEGMTPLSPTVTSSEPLYNDDGSWTEGMYRVELQLWAD